MLNWKDGRLCWREMWVSDWNMTPLFLVYGVEEQAADAMDLAS